MNISDIERFITNFSAKDTIPFMIRKDGELYDVEEDMLAHIGRTTKERGYHAAIVLDITKIEV